MVIYRFINKVISNNSISIFIILTTFNSTGEKWFHRRRLLTPSFHFEILKDFLLIMNEQTDILILNLKNEASNNRTFDVCPYIVNCTLDIICGNNSNKVYKLKLFIIHSELFY